MRGFGSDNHSGVHPRILKAISDCNVDHEPSYGTDPLTERFAGLIAKLFGSDAKGYFVFNGTAANVLALGQLVRSHESVLCSSVAHVNVDECGAPEKFLGARVIGIASPDGKLTPDCIKPYLVRRGDQHFSQIRAISMTQPTELGLVYTPSEIEALSALARANGLLLHMDGARLVNAAVSLEKTLKELTTDCGVDVVSLGGTKSGLLFGEVVLFLKRGLDRDFKYVRKQAMQLPSKSRFLAAQFLEFLGTDLWQMNARHANKMAARLYLGLRQCEGVKVTREPAANAVFAIFPRAWVGQLKEVSFFYVWDEHSFECRLMTTWDTRESEIDDFVAAVQRLSQALDPKT